MLDQGLFDILLIDGDGERAAFLSALIRRSGSVRVCTQLSARDALTTFSRARFDAILCSTGFSDIDCWRFLRMIRSGRFGFGATPAFVLSDPESLALLRSVADEHTDVIDSSDEQGILPSIREHCAGKRALQILVVEDEAAAAQATARALDKYYRVEIAASGHAALNAWRRTRHHLVVLDLGLPDTPGTAVLELLMEDTPEQPVIILTAQDTVERHRELVLAGAHQFLSKPIDLHFLAQVCAQTLREKACLLNARSLQKSTQSQRHVAAHVHAASFRLESGQTAMASAHLRHAMAASGSAGPSDDQWIALVSEADSP
jgi:DNA-binding response OmpR family regulator